MKDKPTTEELQKLMDDIAEWSDKTFGYDLANRAIPILEHLKKEVAETIEAIKCDHNQDHQEANYVFLKAYLEYADMFMLILDSARCFGMDASDLIGYTRMKLEVNKKRKWGAPDEKGIVELIKRF